MYDFTKYNGSEEEKKKAKKKKKRQRLEGERGKKKQVKRVDMRVDAGKVINFYSTL